MLSPLKPFLERAESFLLKSDLWVFATIMMMISLVITLEHEPYTLGAFLGLTLGYAVVFSPVFWFVHVRPQLKKGMNKWGFKGLWAFLLGVYPWMIVLFAELLGEAAPDGLHSYLDPANDFMIGVLCIGMTFLGTASVLYGLLKSKWFPNVRERMKKLMSPAAVLGLFSVLAAMSAIAGHPDYQRSIEGVNDVYAGGFFIGATAQLWLIYLPYLALFLVHHKLLYRKLFQQRGLLYYVVGGVAAMLVFAPIHGVYARLFPRTISWELHTSAFAGGAIAPENFAMAGGFLFFTIPVVLFLEWTRKSRTIAQLQQQQSQTELMLLKEQVNPHFFFNTLNNLYALSLQEAPETPDTVLQLSDLMRYVIYRAKEERVALHEEVDYLRDYLDLQRIRLAEHAEVDFVVNVENGALQVPPLLFIILVENAFKHGIEKATGECYLQLELTEQDGEVSVICRNSVEENGRDNGLPPGIGLGNLTRRLELLYPEAHSLNTYQTENEYRVELTFWQAVTLREAELGLEADPVAVPVEEYV